MCNKNKILKHLCYTELVYGRINKKLKMNLTKSEIEELILNVISNTKEEFITKIGKNYYLANSERKIKITINSHTYRIITVDKIIG